MFMTDTSPEFVEIKNIFEIRPDAVQTEIWFQILIWTESGKIQKIFIQTWMIQIQVVTWKN